VPHYRPLHELTPGQRFETKDCQKRGTLLRLGKGSALVEWDALKPVNGQTTWGDAFSFTKKEKVTVTRDMLVAKLVKRRKR
jgi:hypothetical protein